MRQRQRSIEAAQRAAERRKREDEAPRLKNEAPGLTSLKLEIEEYQGEGTIVAARHTRHIVVDHAPAMFDMPCGDPSCKDGGHDLTHQILPALRSKRAEFDGEDACAGRTGSAPCRRVLRFVAHASYS